MDIPHTGMSKFTHKNRVFHLNDIFLIPSTSKNLLSVYQLCCDNHVFIEFDCHKVKVKDAGTKEVLLGGIHENGLYRLPIHISRSVSCALI